MRAACLMLLVAVGCADANPGELNDEEYAFARTLGPLPALPADPTNRYADEPAAAELGRRLFYETRWSGALLVGSSLGRPGDRGKVSCATCHDPASYFADGRKTNVSAGIGYTGRNAPTIVNSAFFTWPGWGGKQDSAWTLQAMLPEQPAEVIGGDRCAVAHLVFEAYGDAYAAAFDDHPLPAALAPGAPDAARFPPACKPGAVDGAWERMTAADQAEVNRLLADVGKAFEAYQRRLVSGDSPLDRWLAGQEDALSPAAVRGLRLFVGKGACVACHAGPLLSDAQYHNLGVAQSGPNVPAQDLGRESDLRLARTHLLSSAGSFSDSPETGAARLAVTARDSDAGAFRTPSLRGVALTAPYFHTGGAATLRDVVEHYDRGGASEGFAGTKDRRLRPLLLTDEEKADLVAFLASLTGEPVGG